MPSVMTTATSYCEVAEAGSYSARSQLVEPSAVTLVQRAYVRLKAAASARMETETRPGAFASPRMAGEHEEKVKRAIDDGVPWSASTKVSAAVFSAGTLPLIDPDRSMINATLSPHRSGNAGLPREDCQVPGDAVRLLPPDPTMKRAARPRRGRAGLHPVLGLVQPEPHPRHRRHRGVTVPVTPCLDGDHGGTGRRRRQGTRLRPLGPLPRPRPGRPRPQHHRYGQTHPAAARRRPGSLLRTIDSLGSVERAGMAIIASVPDT